MPASPEPAAPAATLARLLDALGSGLIEVISAPRGLQLAVAEPVIFDPVAGQIATTDDLVLAVGVDATTPLALDAVEAARRAGACAVIMKTGGQVPGLLARAADAAGVALLEIPVATSWAQLLTLLRTARGAIGRPYGTAGPGLQVGDLFGLANAIAATVGGATTIEDLQSNVLAYSSLEQPTDQPRRDTILGRRVPSGWSRELVDRGVWRELYRSSDVVAVHGLRVPVSGGDHADLEPRLAIMIRAGGEPLGSIWVMQGDQQLTGTAADALRSAAEIAAMHLLHHREGADLDRRQRAELLRTLLEGGRAGPAIATLRLSHGTPLTVLGFTPDLDEPEDAAELALQRVAGLITLHIEAYRQHAHTVCIDDVVYVLLSSPDVTDRQKVRGIAAELGDRAEQGAKVPVRAGIGAAVPDVTGLPSSRRDADRVLRVLRHRGERVGHADDLRAAIALMHLEDLMAEDPLLREGKAGILTAHDVRRGTSYVATLRAFLDCSGDAVAASAALHVHRNTFRYRLARLVELAGLDLTDPGERLITHLQLRLMDRLPTA